MRAGLWYTLVAALVAVGVAAVGGGWGEGQERTAVWVGVAAGLAVQVAAFWVLFVVLFPDRLVLAHGLGMIARFTMVGVLALVVVPLLRLPAAPTLLSLVAVLFVTTLAEPVILQIASKSRR